MALFKQRRWMKIKAQPKVTVPQMAKPKRKK